MYVCQGFPKGRYKKCLFIKITQYNDWHMTSSQWTFVDAMEKSFLVFNFTTPKKVYDS